MRAFVLAVVTVFASSVLLEPTTAQEVQKSAKSSSAEKSKSKKISKRAKSSKKKRTARRGGTLRGLASYYWQPQRVASGGWFNPNALTAAHKTLPFGTRVRVTNLRNGRSVVVRINDRGPYIRGRIIDLSRRAAQIVGMTKAGVVPVSVKIM
ncbi:MAG: septal ring lytic transglycosylase RlpA family protein [Hyphomicrobiaceae bacterium]